MNTRASAFSRVDLIGLVAVSATLLAVIVPAIRAARQQSSIDRQLSHAKEWTMGWKSYTLDNADAVVVAAPAWNWVHPTGSPGTPRMLPPNPFGSNLVGSSTNKVYTFHMLPWVSGGDRQIQIDSATVATFNSRSNVPISTENVSGQQVASFGDNTKPSAFAWHPSLGYNGVFVGGSFRHGAYADASASGPYTGNNPQNGGHFYVRRLSQITNPQLTIFAPARGGDLVGTTFWNYGQSYPNQGVVRPGHWLVTPPRGVTNHNTQAWIAENVTDGQRFNPQRIPSTYGNLDFRLGSAVKTFTASADGSVRIRSIDDLRDMRLWATQATSRNWNWTPGQNP